jgi:hypothetical protein
MRVEVKCNSGAWVYGNWVYTSGVYSIRACQPGEALTAYGVDLVYV